MEVTRLCNDGELNGCSMLYSAARWRFLWHAPGRNWDTRSRARTDKHPTENKHAYGWGEWPAAERLAA